MTECKMVGQASGMFTAETVCQTHHFKFDGIIECHRCPIGRIEDLEAKIALLMPDKSSDV